MVFLLNNWIVLAAGIGIILLILYFRSRRSVQTNGNSQDDQQNQNVVVHTLADLDKEVKEYQLSDAPKSTLMSANELYMLDKLGYEPIQVVYGNIVYSMGLQGVGRSIIRAFRRGEMVDFTKMINDARVIARNRMLSQAIEIGATHVFGVVIETREFADFLEVTATGTAAHKSKEAEDVPIAAST